MDDRERSHSRRHSHGKSEGERRHHHHHHHHRLRHRLKRWLRKHRWVGIAAILFAVAALGAFWLLRKDYKNRQSMNVMAANPKDIGGSYRIVSYDGKDYRYNNRITSILFAGIDSDENIKQLSTYTMAPRADTIILVVMDELNARVSFIALNRDTMTDIHRFTLDGTDRGEFVDHLGNAYTYGDGGEVSCENLCEAVSKLLYDVPIDGYVVSNRASIPHLAELVGPVEVVVPNNDLAEQGFTAGQTAVIDADNLELFVRSRDTGLDLSNVTRMERQRAYIESCISTLMDLLTRDPLTAWDKIEQAEDDVITDITRNRYLALSKALKNVRYTGSSYLTPEGRQVVGPKYDEFYPDMSLLRSTVIDLFYIET